MPSPTTSRPVTEARPPRRGHTLPALLGLLAVTAASGGCRGPTAVSRTATEGGAEKASPTACPAVPALVMDAPPRLLVTAAGDAFVVLALGPVQLSGTPAWSVAYAAGPGAPEETASAAQARLEATAQVLFGVFRPVAEAAQLERVSVTAVSGTPAAGGVAQEIGFVKGAQGWQATAPQRRPVDRVPFLPRDVTRDLAEETDAREVALAFLGDLDRADYDAAWAKSSALVKAGVSRVTFEGQLAALPKAAGGAPHAELYSAFFANAGRYLPGAEMEVWFTRRTEAGPAVDTFQLRLDDDMAWRVAGVRELSGAARAPGAAG
jgi:hypothetical protein